MNRQPFPRFSSPVLASRGRGALPWTFAAVSSLLLLLLVLLPSPAQARTLPEDVPVELRAAIADFVNERGYPYAGFCDEIDQSLNRSRWCAWMQSYQDFRAEVKLGPVTSTQPYFATFLPQGKTWKVYATDVPYAVTGELRAAIAAHIESRGYSYAGLCDEIDPTKHPGRWCASVQSIDGSRARVLAGAVGSSTRYTVTFSRTSSGWFVAESNIPFAIPPALRSAMASLLESRGHAFAGFCAEIDENRYRGAWCAIVEYLDGTRAVLVARPVLSSTLYSATFDRIGNLWVVSKTTIPYAVPDTLRAAIAGLVQERGYGYAGLCDEIDRTWHAGKWCATVASIEGGRAVVNAGPVSQGLTYSSTFDRTGANWVLRSTNIPYAVTAELRAAIASLVQARGYSYAGLCGEIDPTQHPGRWCATPQSIDSTRATFVVGPVSASASYSASFNRAGSGWVLASTTIPYVIPAELRAAIATLVQARGYQYAGLCEEIDASRNLERWCARIESIDSATAVVSAGPVLSGLAYRTTFDRFGSTWLVRNTTIPFAIPVELRLAIASLAQMRGYVYLGLCKEIGGAGAPGSWCGFIQSIDERGASVTLGPVASDSIFWATFSRSGSGWNLVSTSVPWSPSVVKGPLWVNDLEYGSRGGGFYWDPASNLVWTAERGWHQFSPQRPRPAAVLWVNHLAYGSRGGGFYLDPFAARVWTAERGWHQFSPQPV